MFKEIKFILNFDLFNTIFLISNTWLDWMKTYSELSNKNIV